MGAITSGGIRVLNYDVVTSLGISSQIIDQVTADELQELQRRDRVYRGDLPTLNVKNRTVIVMDDGIATGSTILAAITLLQRQQPKSIVLGTAPKKHLITHQSVYSTLYQSLVLSW